MIDEYRILRSGSHETMERSVASMLNDGWQPHGQLSHSVVWAIGHDGRPNGHILNELYVQAMVKE